MSKLLRYSRICDGENVQRTRVWLITLLLSGLLVSGLLVGCGPKTGIVSGEVTYKGKPIPGGTLTFQPLVQGANSIPYAMERDGKYRVQLPVGEVLVCIDNREFEPHPQVTMPSLPGMKLPPEAVKGLQASAQESNRVSDRWVVIPERYYQIETSGLKFKVEGKEQYYNIDLTD